MPRPRVPAASGAGKSSAPSPTTPAPPAAAAPELVIITGLSGSGKGSMLKALEDLGYYAVDNLPVELIPKFAELTRDSSPPRWSWTFAKAAASTASLRCSPKSAKP
jgi:hypothetical protein